MQISWGFCYRLRRTFFILYWKLVTWYIVSILLNTVILAKLYNFPSLKMYQKNLFARNEDKRTIHLFKTLTELSSYTQIENTTVIPTYFQIDSTLLNQVTINTRKPPRVWFQIPAGVNDYNDKIHRESPIIYNGTGLTDLPWPLCILCKRFKVGLSKARRWNRTENVLLLLVSSHHVRVSPLPCRRLSLSLSLSFW